MTVYAKQMENMKKFAIGENGNDLAYKHIYPDGLC